jgi:hypothetical protein
MGLDVESESTLNETIDRAKAAAADLEVTAQKVGVNLVDRVMQGIHGIIADVLKDENAIIAALDGWSVTISPITIRLTKPKPKVE